MVETNLHLLCLLKENGCVFKMTERDMHDYRQHISALIADLQCILEKHTLTIQVLMSIKHTQV